jgi:hypothetical protein
LMCKIDKDEQKFLDEVREKVDELINELCDKYGFDRAYFNFVLRCDILDSNFQKVDEVVLIDDTDYGFCVFCHQKTYFSDGENYYCAKCYGFMKNSGKEKSNR